MVHRITTLSVSLLKGKQKKVEELNYIYEVSVGYLVTYTVFLAIALFTLCSCFIYVI